MEETTSLSIGLTALEMIDHVPLETLIASADAALYRAKMLGRNRVIVGKPLGKGRSSNGAAASGSEADKEASNPAHRVP